MLSDKRPRQIAYLNYNLLISVETVSSLVSNFFFQHSKKSWLQGLKSPINQIKHEATDFMTVCLPLEIVGLYIGQLQKFCISIYVVRYALI